MVQRYNLFFYYLSSPPPQKKKVTGVTDPSVSLRLYYRHIGPIMHIRRSETKRPVAAQRD